MTETPPAEPSEPRASRDQTSRRTFLRTAGFTAAGVAVGGAAAAGIAAAVSGPQHPPEFTPLPPRSEPGFDHVVVLMFENRSFDNMLGWLYDAEDKPNSADFDGLAQGKYSNTAPDGTVIPAHVYTGSTDEIMQHPRPDPGEAYPHVNTQLFSSVRPEANHDLVGRDALPPFNTPEPGTTADMSGFVTDYIINYTTESGGRAPTEAEYRLAMGGFEPAMLPVLSTLARSFGLFDHWHAGVPSQTFCNRSFFHASSSHGQVTNERFGGYDKWINGPEVPTIFNRLEDAGLSWRVYYDETQLVSLTGMLHAPVLRKYWKSNFRGMTQFHQDAANGDLPVYSFVEPRMVFNHNDMHPPYGVLRTGDVDDESVYNSAWSDVRAGDALLADVYDAIRTSASTTGSNALNTALLVTFDEHGGTYDHVTPPSATPPGDGYTEEMGFRFDRLGCRVPSILVSAYTEAGGVIHDEMHHGALIATLSELHGLKPLTARDDGAKTLFTAINRTEPRQPYTWPTPKPLYSAKNPEADDAPPAPEAHRARPLTPPARGLFGLLLTSYDVDGKLPETYGEAFDALNQYGHGLFGVTDADAAESPPPNNG